MSIVLDVLCRERSPSVAIVFALGFCVPLASKHFRPRHLFRPVYTFDSTHFMQGERAYSTDLQYLASQHVTYYSSRSVSLFKMGDDKTGQEAPFPLTDLDKWILSQTDEEFKFHDWEELREIIGASCAHGSTCPHPQLLTVPNRCK